MLAATEHLHKRIAKMKERIRQLEDALAILQAKSSNEPHPLLRDDLLSANTEHDEEEMGLSAAIRLATQALGNDAEPHRTVAPETLEVAVLDRTRSQPRKFKRLREPAISAALDS